MPPRSAFYNPRVKMNLDRDADETQGTWDVGRGTIWDGHAKDFCSRLIFGASPSI